MTRYVVNSDDVAAPPADFSRQDLSVLFFLKRRESPGANL